MQIHKGRRGVLAFSIAATSMSLSVAANGDSSQVAAVSLDETALLLQDIPSVYSASKYEQKVTEAPSSISIVTADEILKYGYRTLADILESLRGFVVSDDRNYRYTSIRGFGPPGDYNNRFLVLIDGRRINDPIYDSSGIGRTFLLDVETIDRVELIRGPSSSLYGANAFFGVVNLITKRGRDLEGVEVAAAYGRFDTVEGRATYGKRFDNGVELLLSGTYFETDGDNHFYPDFDDPTTNNGVAAGIDDEEADNLFAKLSYQDFTLTGAYYSRDKTIPTAAWDTAFNDPRTGTIDEHTYLNLSYEHTFSRHLGTRADLSYQHYDYFGDYVYDYSEDDEPFLVVNKDNAYARWWGAELQFTYTAFERHKLVWGAEVQRNNRQDQENFDLEVYLDDRRDSTRWGIYAQDEFAIRDDLILNIGVRHDSHEGFDDTTNPRLALIYNLSPKATAKFLYGEAFRAPNVYELFYHDGFFTQKPATKLEPETIDTIELILEYSLTPHLRGVAAVFHNEVEDLITLTTDPADELLVFDNTDKVKASGIELELEGKWPSGWAGRVSYSYQDAKNETTSDILPNSPDNLVKVNLIAPLFERRLFAGLELQYTDRRRNVRGVDIESSLVTNLTLHAPQLWRGLNMSVSIYNLFDEDYADPGSEEHTQEGIKQDGRTYRLKVRYAF